MNDRIEKIRAYLQQNPDDCFLNHALALEYIKLGDDVSAGELFKKNMEYDAAYVATYYHYAKLLERLGEEQKAIAVYEQGMEQCKAAGDNHSYSELRSAYEELTF
ncbi:MAG: hypothetical protein H6550_12070 [Chitinophagales bacterium]|nr:hypothetical protein [Chitinophagales bacterium]